MKSIPDETDRADEKLGTAEAEKKSTTDTEPDLFIESLGKMTDMIYIWTVLLTNILYLERDVILFIITDVEPLDFSQLDEALVFLYEITDNLIKTFGEDETREGDKWSKN